MPCCPLGCSPNEKEEEVEANCGGREVEISSEFNGQGGYKSEEKEITDSIAYEI